MLWIRMSISSLGNTNHVDSYCQWPIAYMPKTHCIYPTWKIHICTAQISICRFIRFTVVIVRANAGTTTRLCVLCVQSPYIFDFLVG